MLEPSSHVRLSKDVCCEQCRLVDSTRASFPFQRFSAIRGGARVGQDGRTAALIHADTLRGPHIDGFAPTPHTRIHAVAASP